MKILLIGFLALFGWSAAATHFYVCKIKGLCNETETIEINAVNQGDNIVVDSLKMLLKKEQAVIPGNLLI